jgi:hypothetical protein
MTATTKSISFKFADGECPNQAWGWVDGKWFYFRGRWGAWTLEVGDGPNEFEMPEKVEIILYGGDVIDGEEPGWWSPDKIEPFVRGLLEGLMTTDRCIFLLSVAIIVACAFGWI